MTGSICAIHNCLNGKLRKLSKSFFRFPKNKELCKEWIIKVGRSDLDEIFKKEGPEKLYTSYIICSDHFSEKDYNNPKNKSQGLKRNRVPSLNLPSNSFETDKRVKKEKIIVEPDYETTNPNEIIPQDLRIDSLTLEGPCEYPEQVLLLRKRVRQCQTVASKRRGIIQPSVSSLADNASSNRKQIPRILKQKEKKPPVKSSDSKNGTSNGNRNPRKRRLKLPSESDTEPEDQSVDDVDDEFDIFAKHVASKLNQMPFYNALQCQEKIETLINDELLIVESRQEEIDTRLIKQEPEISDELCDENNIMKKIKQEPSMIDEGRLLVQSCQNEIETVIIKQEPGISDELCDENNTPTLLNQVPASPFCLYSIKTENISDTELQ